MHVVPVWITCDDSTHVFCDQAASLTFSWEFASFVNQKLQGVMAAWGQSYCHVYLEP